MAEMRCRKCIKWKKSWWMSIWSILPFLWYRKNALTLATSLTSQIFYNICWVKRAQLSIKNWIWNFSFFGLFPVKMGIMLKNLKFNTRDFGWNIMKIFKVCNFISPENFGIVKSRTTNRSSLSNARFSCKSVVTFYVCLVEMITFI